MLNKTCMVNFTSVLNQRFLTLNDVDFYQPSFIFLDFLSDRFRGLRGAILIIIYVYVVILVYMYNIYSMLSI